MKIGEIKDETKDIDPKHEEYLESLISFVNRLPMTKKQKINFICELVDTKEQSFVNGREKLEVKEGTTSDKMPIYSNAETGEIRYADDNVLFQSIGDSHELKQPTLSRSSSVVTNPPLPK